MGPAGTTDGAGRDGTIVIPVTGTATITFHPMNVTAITAAAIHPMTACGIFLFNIGE